MAHTPGPWAYRTHPNDPAFEHIAADSGAIIAKPMRMGSPGVMAENAALMAAAPAMLAALQAGLDALGRIDDFPKATGGDHPDIQNRALDAMAAAIAAATGAPTCDDAATAAAANLSSAGLIEAAGEAVALAGPTGEATCGRCGYPELPPQAGPACPDCGN